MSTLLIRAVCVLAVAAPLLGGCLSYQDTPTPPTPVVINQPPITAPPGSVVVMPTSP